VKITNIKQQQKDKNRASFFIDGSYSFSLTISQWQDSNLKIGDTISPQRIDELKKQSDYGKLYAKALDYLARRKRSIKEMRDYLMRKDAAAEDSELIIRKLLDLKYLNDEDFARSWVVDRNDFKPTSRRKLFFELKQKGIEGSVIERVLDELNQESTSLKRIIISKRKQKRYQDDTKLIAYLCRNGFSYGDVKKALEDASSQE